MKSKSFELKQKAPEKVKHNKTFEFVGFYKSVAETNKQLTENTKPIENGNLESPKYKKESVKRERSPNKAKRKHKNEAVDVSQIVIHGPNVNCSFGGSTPLNDSKVTSTINAKIQGSGDCRVKSIMKTKPAEDHPMDGSTFDTSFNPKKRNKSVSFMLEDTEAVLVKKTKSDDSVNKKSETKEKIIKKKSYKKFVKDNSFGKENKANSNQNVNIEQEADSKLKEHQAKPKKSKKTEEPTTIAEGDKNKILDKKRKFRKVKRNKSNEGFEKLETNTITTVGSDEKENKASSNQKLDIEQEVEGTTKEHKVNTKKYSKYEGFVATVEGDGQSQEKKRKIKKFKRSKDNEVSEQLKRDINNAEVPDTKTKKLKKKKRHVKQQNPETQSEGEPASKFPKKDIVEDLENLSIGDNAHTITNLLDEMTVVDKDKKKKLRQKLNKVKLKTTKIDKKIEEDSKEVKERVKWNKRKWNKDKKGDFNEDIATTVIVENLPISIMLTYKKLLADHFEKYGLIKKIGIAEMYPTEESMPVFTTTINFYSDGAATEALQQDNTIFEGSRILIRRPLPPTDTTLVIRSYAELNEQSVTSLFTGAGKIRNVRHLVKGKKSMSTAFVEFDGPESVKRAMKMAAEAKINGKKVHVAKYEVRKKKEKIHKSGTENGADTEDSND